MASAEARDAEAGVYAAQQGRIEGATSNLRAWTVQLRGMYTAFRTAPSAVQERALSAELDAILIGAAQDAGSAYADLRKMEMAHRAVRTAAREEPEADTELDRRQRGHALLARHYVQAMRALQAQKRVLTTQARETVLLRARRLFPGLPESELERRVAGDPATFIRSALLAPSPVSGGEACAAYDSATQRARDVELLERSVLEADRAFLDLSLLVDAQSEALYDVSLHVEEGAGHTHDEEVAPAGEHPPRKYWCCAVLIVACILALVASVTSTSSVT
jgi:hypothetical protein